MQKIEFLCLHISYYAPNAEVAKQNGDELVRVEIRDEFNESIRSFHPTPLSISPPRGLTDQNHPLGVNTPTFEEAPSKTAANFTCHKS